VQILKVCIYPQTIFYSCLLAHLLKNRRTTPQTADQQCTWNCRFISFFGGPIFL